jgi:hypothetical protein
MPKYCSIGPPDRKRFFLSEKSSVEIEIKRRPNNHAIFSHQQKNSISILILTSFALTIFVLPGLFALPVTFGASLSSPGSTTLPNAGHSLGNGTSSSRPTPQTHPADRIGATAASLNWGGYAVASSFSSPSKRVTAVYGSWIVQTVALSASATYSAQWIGIGGYFDGTLIQTGTESDATVSTTTYDAWYETLPHAESPLFPVSPGDVMTASVVCTSSCSNSRSQNWAITITDVTSGRSSSLHLKYGSSRESAEWIEERPSVGGFLSTLANFGTADFGAAYTSQTSFNNFATIAGAKRAVGAFANQPIYMVDNNGNPDANPGPLGKDQASFTMAFVGGYAPPPPPPSAYFSPTGADSSLITNCAGGNLFNPCTDTGSGDNQVGGTATTTDFTHTLIIDISGSTVSDPYSRVLNVWITPSTGTPVEIESTVVGGSFSLGISVPSADLPICTPTASPCTYSVQFELTTFVGSWLVILGLAGT